MEHRDIPEIIDMQAIVWQDHFLKERNMKVPIMRRSVRNTEYYIAKDPGGCFVALDGKKIVGSIFSHSWGSIGWFGPLEVNPVCQGRGIGKALVAESVKYLKAKGCKTIGCETMAGSAHNIAFYSKLGFKAKSLSYVFYKKLGDIPPESVDNSCVRAYEPGKDLPGFKKIWGEISPGLDYSIELSSVGKGLGHLWVKDTLNGSAHAIVHTYEMFDDSQNAIIKLLVAPKDDDAAAKTLLKRCEASAAIAGKTGMFLRTYDASPPDVRWFLEGGYELQGTSIRLILEGEDETDRAIHISCWSG